MFMFRNRQEKNILTYIHTNRAIYLVSALVFSSYRFSIAAALQLGFSVSSFPLHILPGSLCYSNLRICHLLFVQLFWWSLIGLIVQFVVSLCSNHIIPCVCPSLFCPCLSFLLNVFVICLFDQVMPSDIKASFHQWPPKLTVGVKIR